MSTANLPSPLPDQTALGPARMVSAVAAAQLVLHAWFALSSGDPRIWMPHVVAWLLDLFVLIVLAAIVWGAGRALARLGLRPRPWTLASNAVIVAMGLVLASYPGVLTEFLAFPMSIFHADAATAWFFVSEYLGWKGLWPLLASGAVVGVASRAPWQLPSPRKRLMVVVPVLVLSAVVLLQPAPQPLVYAFQDVARGWLFGGRRAVPSLARPAGAAPAEAPPVVVPPLDRVKTLRYDHVLVLVLEGVTTERFKREFLSRPRGYFAKVRDRSAYFEQYYTTNLDSYTSLIAMLTSVQVPYRAYANPSVYEPVNEAPSLVGQLARRGFRTLYLCTAEYQPFVPVRQDWTRILHMGDLNVDGWQTMAGSKVESGVEDRAGMPAVLDFVASHPRTLVVQEMIFGHSPRWTAKTGREQLEYYDAYLVDLLAGLEKRRLADRTLLVVVSDHGDRADSTNVENYHVPLLITGRGISPSRNSAYLSHSDFWPILGQFLADLAPPKARRSIVAVGSTERWVYGEITSGGSYQFIDNDTGAVLAGRGTLEPQALFDRFQALLNAFAARYQR